MPQINWGLSGRWNEANALPSLPKGGGTALAVGGYIHKLRTLENTAFERFLYPTTKQSLVPLPLGKGGNALVQIPSSNSPTNPNLSSCLKMK